MGGRPSKHRARHHCGGQQRQQQQGLPAFVLIDWDAAFLGARMLEGEDTQTRRTSDPSHDALCASSPALAQAFRPLIDARRLIALAEGGTQPPHHQQPTSSLAGRPASSIPPPLSLNVRGRLVLFPAGLSVVNHRLLRLFHRRRYRPILAPREMQGHAVARALGRFGRRLSRHRLHWRQQGRPQGAVVVVVGDGGLERQPAFMSALRALLQRGFALEAWAWAAGSANAANGGAWRVYEQLAAEFPPTPHGGGVRLRPLEEHKARLRYGGVGLTGRGGLDGLVASTLHSVAAALASGVAAALGPSPSAPPPPVSHGEQQPPQQPPSVPVAVPLMVGVGYEGNVQQGYVLEGKLVVESSDEEEEGEGEQDNAAAASSAAAAAAAEGEEEEEELPAYLLDPLTFELLDDPVLVPSGYTFSRSVILDQIRRWGTDPFTNAPLAEGDLRPNRALAEAVEGFRRAKAEGEGGAGR